MAQLIYRMKSGQGFREQRFAIQKRMTTLGTEPTHDVVVSSEAPGLVFTLLQKEGASSAFDLVPASVKIQLNGSSVNRTTALRSCDRLEWPGGVAIFVNSEVPLTGGTAGTAGMESLTVLQNLAATLQGPASLQAGLHQALDALVRMANAEIGYLLSEVGEGSGWKLLASSRSSDTASERPNRKELFSNTILQEALAKRGPVYVENIVGHAWADHASVIEAKIFSAACFPLCVADRVFGAVFLFTRSPGRSIRRESLAELGLLATQVGLMLALQAELATTRQENARLRTLVKEWPGSLVYESSAMEEVAKKLQKLAPTPLSILILGETGTGKELVAREIHARSDRAKAPFVAINCAAIPGQLLESTLFGYERGAFTGAVRAQTGKFAQAGGGTLFLDEIGDLPLELQAKLLRVLQEREVEPLGASKPIPIDVRVVAATHQDLDAAVRAGRFRQDLYFRLNGAAVKLPPLRERKDDIVCLARFFLEKCGQKSGNAKSLSSEAEQTLSRHSWPGNVRELEQVITRAAFLADGDEILAHDLEFSASAADLREQLTLGSETDWPSLEQAQLAFTREYVQRILSRNDGNRAATATDLGISERTLYRILSDQRDSAGRPL